MNKEEIMKEKQRFVEWAISLKKISDELWFKPFRSGSWGTADVISHFISWDEFLIENRISPLIRNEEFPKIHVDVEAINREATNFARSGISKAALISQFVAVRGVLVSKLGEIPTHKFAQPCPGKEEMTLSEYFVGMIDHDLKHKEQIDFHIKKNS